MQDSFIALTLLTLGAAAVVWALQRLQLSPILGYLMLGILVRPFQHYLFHDPENANTVAEMGVVLLMFFVGLEFHLAEMKPMLRIFLCSGTLQVLATACAGGAIAWFCGSTPLGAAVLGMMLAFSSTALVLKAFEEQRQSDSQRARMSLAILLLQDIAAILTVAVLPLLATFVQPGQTSLNTSTTDALARMALLFVILPFLFISLRYLLPRLFDRAAAARAPEAFSLLSLGACFSVALAAQLAGASLALGAFLGGLMLCQTPFASQILADLSTLRNLALAFFFVTIGMLVDLNFVAAHAGSLIAALALLVIFKALITFLSLKLFQVPAAVGAGVALALAQAGEFSFVLGRQAMTPGMQLLTPDAYQFVLALAVMSMLLTPFLVRSSARFGSWIASRLGGTQPPDTEVALHSGAPESIRAIVVGYGPVGRTLARIMKDFNLEPVVIDMNIETIRKLTASGFQAVFGDAGRREILKAAGIEHATYLLVTLPDLPGRIPVVATARMLNPSIKILTRARYLAERPMLEEAGATAVSYEEAEVAVSLAGFLLKEIGADEAAFKREATRIRSEIAIRTGFTMVMQRPRNSPSGNLEK